MEIKVRINRDTRFQKLTILQEAEDGKYAGLLGLAYIDARGEVCLDDVLYHQKEQFHAVVEELRKMKLKGFYVNPNHLNALQFCAGIKGVTPANWETRNKDKKLSFRFV